MYKNFINRIDGSTSKNLAGHNLILYVVSVVKDTSVTLRSEYFPKGQDFLIRMGRYGTHGLGGDEINTVNTGDSGIFGVTLSIPSDLQGKSPLDVRFDDVYGQSAEISFYNCTGCGQGPKETPVYLSDLTSNAAIASSSSSYYYSGIPATSFVSVVTDTSVTFYGYNFPTNQDFTVTIGPYGTYGVGGVVQPIRAAAASSPPPTPSHPNTQAVPGLPSAGRARSIMPMTGSTIRPVAHQSRSVHPPRPFIIITTLQHRSSAMW